MSHVFFILEVKSDGWIEEGPGHVSGPIYRSWNGFVRTNMLRRDDRRGMPNKAGCRRDRRRAGALFSRRTGRTKDPRIFLPANIPKQKADRSNDGKPDGFPSSDEFLEWMVRRYALRDRRTRYAMEFHAIVCSGCLHQLPRAGISRLGYLKLPSSRTGLEISLLGITFFLAFRRNK